MDRSKLKVEELKDVDYSVNAYRTKIRCDHKHELVIIQREVWVIINVSDGERLDYIREYTNMPAVEDIIHNTFGHNLRLIQRSC
jgi:hypothetical protein